MRALTAEEGSIHQRNRWLRDVAGVMIRRHLAVRAAELNVADPVLITTVEEQLAYCAWYCVMTVGPLVTIRFTHLERMLEGGLALLYVSFQTGASYFLMVHLFFRSLVCQGCIRNGCVMITIGEW